VLQSVAECCRVLQSVAVHCSVMLSGAVFLDMWVSRITLSQCVAVCCGVLQFVAVCCSTLQCDVEWCRVCLSMWDPRVEILENQFAPKSTILKDYGADF